MCIKTKTILLILAIILLSLPFAFSQNMKNHFVKEKPNFILEENNFKKLIYEDKKIYTESKILNSNYFIGIDKIFYGSSKGQAEIRIYHSAKNSEEATSSHWISSIIMANGVLEEYF